MFLRLQKHYTNVQATGILSRILDAEAAATGILSRILDAEAAKNSFTGDWDTYVTK